MRLKPGRKPEMVHSASIRRMERKMRRAIQASTGKPLTPVMNLSVTMLVGSLINKYGDKHAKRAAKEHGIQSIAASIPLMIPPEELK